jgi:hypothetical protein
MLPAVLGHGSPTHISGNRAGALLALRLLPISAPASVPWGVNAGIEVEFGRAVTNRGEPLTAGGQRPSPIGSMFIPSESGPAPLQHPATWC